MPKTKTLTAYLFEALDNISRADESNIDIAVKKASATIELSQQALNVAQMKLEVINATGQLGETFEEICDVPFELAPPALPENNSGNSENQEQQTSEPPSAQDDENQKVITYGNRFVSKQTLGTDRQKNREY